MNAENRLLLTQWREQICRESGGKKDWFYTMGLIVTESIELDKGSQGKKGSHTASQHGGGGGRVIEIVIHRGSRRGSDSLSHGCLDHASHQDSSEDHSQSEAGRRHERRR